MSVWRAKALELLPEFRSQFLHTSDKLELWRQVEREFYAARQRGDDELISRCLRYAAWALHPTPHAKAIAEVSALAVQLLHRHVGELHQWMTRNDMKPAQKGLRWHLGEDKYADFEVHFFKKTKGYPRNKTKG
jgi:hypothetical protein